MSQIYILDDVDIYLISIVYKTWPDPLHHFSGQPCSTSFLNFSKIGRVFSYITRMYSSRMCTSPAVAFEGGGVCLGSVCPGGVSAHGGVCLGGGVCQGVSAWGEVSAWGCLPGGRCLPEWGVCPRGLSVQGVSAQGGVCRRGCVHLAAPPPIGQSSWRMLVKTRPLSQLCLWMVKLIAMR